MKQHPIEGETQVPGKVPGKATTIPTEGQNRQDTGKVPGKATTMPTMPTEGQGEKNTGKVKQYTEGDIKEFKKNKRTKNAIEITEEYKKKNNKNNNYLTKI